MESTRPQPAREREVRFGLVLYGGVSLAVYIYGVAYEFQRLIRASRGEEENAWTGVLEAAGTTATVDIVSGTSAGGINGLLLGKALAEGGDLRAVRSLWLDEADLGRLLREESEKGPKSLLRSRRFRELIETGLAQMDRVSLKRPLVPAFDLFVSATRLRPWVRQFRTDLDGLIKTSDYRKSFHLKYRQPVPDPAGGWLGYARSDFSADRNLALAEIAQATSAFPVAFEPVEVAVREENEQLFDDEEPRSDYFSDGGILHNKPFTETISTIFTRAADRPVDRWLVSVEPDPEHTAPTLPGEPGPDVTEVVSKAVMGIPRYQSIAADLARFDERRERVRDAKQRLDAIDRALFADLGGREREERREWRALVLAGSHYPAERRAGVATALTERITAGWPAEAVPRGAAVVEETLHGLDDVEAEERAPGAAGLLDRADAGFQQRRVYRLLELLRPLLREQGADGPLRAPAAAAQRRLWAQFERIETIFWGLFGGDGWWLRPEAFERGEAGFTSHYLLERLGEGLDPIASEVRAICGTLDGVWADAHPGDRQRFTLLFDYFELWDIHLLPLAEVSDLAARDAVRLARISPGDAHYIQKAPDKKLAGDALGHFGGFLKREWRANDLLWGRLDAAETIAGMLFHRVGDEQQVEQATVAAQEEICAEELPEPPDDHRHHMENVHEVGSETLADIPIETRGDLLLRGGGVFRNMLAGLRESDTVPSALGRLFGAVGRLVGWILLMIRWPARAAWGRDRGLGRIVDLAIVFVAFWGIASLALIALGAAGPTRTLWILIGLGLAIFALRCLIALRFARD
jgi:predicted acylesterase/phospholipase RssA